MARVFLKTTGGLFVIVIGLGVTGCFSDIRDICEKEVKCHGGNDADEDACVELLKGERRFFAEYGCRSEYNDYLECAAENMSCEGNNFEIDEKCYEKYEKVFECAEKETGYGNRQSPANPSPSVEYD